MNAIIWGFYDRLSLARSIKILAKKINLETIVSIENKYFEKLFEKDQLVMFDYEQVTRKDYSFFDFDNAIIPDKEIFDDMQKYEAMFYKMAVKRHHFHVESFDVYHNFYIKSVIFWNHIIETYNIKLFINGYVPHQLFDYIVYGLCKIKKIPVIILNHSVAGVIYSYNDIEKEYSDTLVKEYEELLWLYKRGERIEYKLKGPINQYIGRVSRRVEPTYISRSFNFHLLKRGLKHVVVPLIGHNPFSNKEGGIKRFFKFLGKDLEASRKVMYKLLSGICGYKLYARLGEEPDYNQRFIFYSLHFEPEAALTPMGGSYSDQLYVVRTLSAAVKGTSIKIYVKEHPSQIFRSPQFYRDIKALHNVSLIKRSVVSYDLIERALAVSTVTGTAGLEALIKNKPVLLFGNIYYQICKGVYKINGVSSCKEAINEIIESKFDGHKVNLFFKALEDTSCNAYLETCFIQDKSIYKKNQYKQIADYLYKGLQEQGVSEK